MESSKRRHKRGDFRTEYGTGGFYFQQRRSKLDLRSLSKLDLNRIVRDVDLDSLQSQLENIAFGQLDEEDLRFMTDQHIVKLFKVSQLTIEYLLYAQEQLTSSLHGLATKYADKKKTLLRKRDEMNALNESTKSLKKQLQLKKKGVDTLEALIKENSHGKSIHAAVKEANDAKENTKPVDANAVCTVKYYITGPDGICVEMQSPSNMLVFDVISDIRSTFIAKPNLDELSSSDSEEIMPIPVQIRLVCRGKQLLPESTLKENNITTGDSLIAIVDGYTHRNAQSRRRKEKKPVSKPIVSTEESANELHERANLGIMTMLEKQQKVIEDLTNAIRSEQLARKQLDMQLASLEKQYDENTRSGEPRVKSKRVTGVEAGEIESDDENLLLSRQEITTKLARSKKKIVKLEAQVSEAEKYIHQFEYAVGKQNVDMEVLRKELYQSTKLNQPSNTPIIVQLNGLQNASTESVNPAPVQIQPATPAVTVRAEKKKTPPKAVEIPKAIEVIKEAAPAPVAAIPSPPPKPVEKKAEQIILPVQPTKRLKKTDPIGASTIAFYPATNPDLQNRHIHINSSYSGEHGIGDSNLDCISLTLPNDTDFDTLIFELRSAIAEKLDMPLSKIALQLASGQIITLAIDAKEPFSVVEAAAMVTTGQLKVRIIQPLSDRQLDRLVHQYDSAQKRSTNNHRKEKTNAAKILKLLSDSDSDHPTRNRAGVDTSMSKTELDDISSMLHSRDTLEETFRDISDKEGMTDDELIEHRRKLSKMTTKLSDGIHKDISEYKSTIIASVLDQVSSGHEMSDPEEIESKFDENIQSSHNKPRYIQVSSMLKHDAHIAKQQKIDRFQSKQRDIQRLLARASEVREVLIDETDNVPETQPVLGAEGGIAAANKHIGDGGTDSIEESKSEFRPGGGIKQSSEPTGVGGSNSVLGASAVDSEYDLQNDSAVLISSIPNSIPQLIHNSENTQTGMDESMQSFRIHSPGEDEDVTLHGTMNVRRQGALDNDISVEDRYAEYSQSNSNSHIEDSCLNVNNCSDVIASQDSFNVTNNSIRSNDDSMIHTQGSNPELKANSKEAPADETRDDNVHSFVNDSQDEEMKQPLGNRDSVESFDDSIQSSIQSGTRAGTVKRYQGVDDGDGVVSFNNTNRTNHTNTSGVSAVSLSSNDSLLDTAELLKYAGIDLSKTVDSNMVSDNSMTSFASSDTGSVATSVDSNNSTDKLNDEAERRERVVRKADQYESKASEYSNRIERSKQEVHWNHNNNSGIAASIRNEPQLQGGVVVSPMRNRVISPGPSSLFRISSSSNIQDDDKSEENSCKSDDRDDDDEEDEEGKDMKDDRGHEVKHGQERGKDTHDGVAQMEISSINGVSNISNNISHVSNYGTPNAYGTLTPQGKQFNTATPTRYVGDHLTSPFALTPAGESPFNNLNPSSGNRRTPSAADAHAMNNLELSYSTDYEASMDNVTNGANMSNQPPTTNSSNSPTTNQHPLHGGDSLALSESGDAFMDILEDSSNTTSSAFLTGHIHHSNNASASGTPRSKK